jgi:hypothetical protein
MSNKEVSRHVRFSDEDEYVDDVREVPGHRGLIEEDLSADSFEVSEEEEAYDDDYENEYADEEDIDQTPDVLDEAVDALNGIQQCLVTSEGVAIADVLASIATSLRAIAKAVVPVQNQTPISRKK